MQNIIATDISVAQAKTVYSQGSYIDDDILLCENFSDVPLPVDNCRMHCILVALCTQGKASYKVDTIEQTVSENDVIIINTDQLVSDYLLSRDCSGIAFICSPVFFREVITSVHELSSLFLFSRTHPVFHLEEEQSFILKKYFYHIKSIIDNHTHPFRRELTASLFKSLTYELGDVIYANQCMTEERQNRPDAIFTNFIKLVELHYREERRVGWYATQLCITPKYLSETVKAASKRTPSDWIESYVTLEISNLLKNTTMNIKQITQAMHFPNQSFLGKFFKEHVGKSPSQYRKEKL